MKENLSIRIMITLLILQIKNLRTIPNMYLVLPNCDLSKLLIQVMYFFQYVTFNRYSLLIKTQKDYSAKFICAYFR